MKSIAELKLEKGNWGKLRQRLNSGSDRAAGASAGSRGFGESHRQLRSAAFPGYPGGPRCPSAGRRLHLPPVGLAAGQMGRASARKHSPFQASVDPNLDLDLLCNPRGNLLKLLPGDWPDVLLGRRADETV